MLFSVEDIFAAGLGFDIAGAILLAKGLLVSPQELKLRSVTYVGHNPPAIAGLVSDWVDGLFGIIGLSLGFALQIVGYSVVVVAGAGETRGAAGAAAAVYLAVLAACALGVAWAISRPHLVRARVVDVAFADDPDLGRPDFGLLITMAPYVTDESERLVDERDDDYLLRIYGAAVNVPALKTLRAPEA